MKKYTIVVSVIIVILVALTFFLLTNSDRTAENIITNHPMIGQTFKAGSEVYYLENCNNPSSCYSGNTAKEIDRILHCGEQNESVSIQFNNISKVAEGVTFKLIKLISVKNKGAKASFAGEGGVTAVLEDSNGKISTRIFSDLDLNSSSYFGYQDGNICKGWSYSD